MQDEAWLIESGEEEGTEREVIEATIQKQWLVH